MKKTLIALLICGFIGMNLIADSMDSRTITVGDTAITVYRDNTPNTEPDKPTIDNNVFALHKNGKIILVNAGLGGEDGFLKRFIADGHKPEDVSAVLINVMGDDNIGGLLSGRATSTRNEGRGYIVTMPGAVFPNATLYISKIEKEFWDNYPLVRSLGAPPHITRQVTSAYRDRIVTFDFDAEILPGITAIEAVKQRPEQVYSTTIFATRDIMFIGGFTRFAMDTTDAVQQHKVWLQNAADKKLFVAGSRLPFPAIGKLTSDNKEGYTFTEVK